MDNLKKYLADLQIRRKGYIGAILILVLVALIVEAFLPSAIMETVKNFVMGIGVVILGVITLLVGISWLWIGDATRSTGNYSTWEYRINGIFYIVFGVAMILVVTIITVF